MTAIRSHWELIDAGQRPRNADCTACPGVGGGGGGEGRRGGGEVGTSDDDEDLKVKRIFQWLGRLGRPGYHRLVFW